MIRGVDRNTLRGVLNVRKFYIFSFFSRKECQCSQPRSSSFRGFKPANFSVTSSMSNLICLQMFGNADPLSLYLDIIDLRECAVQKNYVPLWLLLLVKSQRAEGEFGDWETNQHDNFKEHQHQRLDFSLEKLQISMTTLKSINNRRRIFLLKNYKCIMKRSKSFKNARSIFTVHKTYQLSPSCLTNC